MHCPTPLSSVACLDLPYFSTLPHTRHDFRRKSYRTHNVVWHSLPFFSETFLILRTIRRFTTYACWSSCKVPAILVRFYWNLNFLGRFSKTSSNTKFNQKPSSGSRDVLRGWAGGHMTTLTVASRNFSNAPNNAFRRHISLYHHIHLQPPMVCQQAPSASRLRNAITQ
jgi:hypothetical protein